MMGNALQMALYASKKQGINYWIMDLGVSKTGYRIYLNTVLFSMAVKRRIWWYSTGIEDTIPILILRYPPNLCKWKHNNYNHIWEQILRASDTGTNLMPCCSEVEDHILGIDFGTFLFGLSLGNWVECERVKQQWKKPCLPQASVEMSNVHGWLVISKHPLKGTNRHCLNSPAVNTETDIPMTHPKSPNSSTSLGPWVSGLQSSVQ